MSLCPGDWQAAARLCWEKPDALLPGTRERDRLVKLRAFNISFEALAAGGWSLLRSELLAKASGLSKTQKCPLGRLRALGRLSWRIRNICAWFGFDLGWLEVRLVPARPERFVDGRRVWRHPK